MHGLYYDRKNDEMFVPVALAGAVLVFRGGATGDEEPIRTLQGPRTQIVRPDTLYVDVEHDELIVDSGTDSILIFDRNAKGEAEPIRVIKGPKTGIANMYGLTADPTRNLIFAANRVGEETGRDTTDSILVFNRTDSGDVAPRARIGGPRTGMLKIRQLQADPGTRALVRHGEEQPRELRSARAEPEPLESGAHGLHRCLECDG